MPDGQIQVSFAAVEEAGSNIASTSKKMDDELDQLRRQLAPLGEAYNGAAKDAWRAVQDSWEKAQEEMNQVLASIGSAVAQAAQSYRDTEGGVTKLWGQ
jgi:WXG100 family type VII secretion target